MQALTEAELRLLDSYDDEQRVLALATTERERQQWQAIFAARRAYREACERQAREALSRPFDFGAAQLYDRTNALMRQRHAVPI